MSSRYRAPVEKRTDRAGATTAFLLTQLGTHAAFEFAKRLAAIDLAPPHAGILRAIGASTGMSQQELAKMLTMQPSRLVVLVDELEAKGLVERRDSRDDRRVYALQLTAKGRRALENVTRISLEHDEAMCRALSETERQQLTVLLQRIADDQKLTPGVHPGYRRFGGPDK
jgi:DNA-binding MarR family transcriptional regulator